MTAYLKLAAIGASAFALAACTQTGTTERNAAYGAAAGAAAGAVIGNNVGDGDAQRYKQFCVGRHRVFERRGISEHDYPAATVVGNLGKTLHLQALASRDVTHTLENPRQVNAYEYPRRFGPRSPSFSRAVQWHDLTLVSGTAAVRGADSQYPGDLARQCQDIHYNLASLMNQSEDASELPLRLTYGRIYLRPGCNLAALDTAVREHLPYAAHWPVLEAEICREELLCEVEAAFQ